MINNTKILSDEKVKSLAQKYESQGFRVFFKPKTDKLPFDLGNYQPDIIAIKDDSGLVIEVKTNLSRVSVDRLQALAEEVSKHQGWRFLLVTLEDIEAKSLPGISEQLPSWQDLADRFHEAHRLIENDEIEQAFKAAFLLLWSTFEGALRKRAVDVSIPIERFPIIGLLKHMYSLGELSISQFDFAQFCFEAWNSLAHGYIQSPYSGNVLEFDTLVSELLTEWTPDDQKESLTIRASREFLNSVVNDGLAKAQKKYPPVEPASQPPDIDLINDSFIGMWSDRQDLSDSTTWVRGVRENEWSKSHD
jgi:Holliday junction resolvase